MSGHLHHISIGAHRGRKLALLSAAAIALTLSSPAIAQQGVGTGAVGGSRTPPPAPTRSDQYNTLRYINGGDYDGAVNLLIVRAYLPEDNQARSNVPYGSGFVLNYLEEQWRILSRYNPSLEYSGEGMQAELQSATATPITNNYMPASHHRVISGLEQAQDAAFRERMTSLNSLLGVLPSIAGQRDHLSASQNSELDRISQNLSAEINAIQAALDASWHNAGLAFQTEQQALEYLSIRERARLALAESTVASRADGNYRDQLADMARTLQARDPQTYFEQRFDATGIERTLARVGASDLRLGVRVQQLGPGAGHLYGDRSLILAPPSIAGQIGELPTPRPVATGSAQANAASGNSAGQNNGSNAGSSRPTQTAEDNTPPRPVPTEEAYPTVSREERERISREAAQRRAAREATARAEAEAAALEAQIAAQRAQQARLEQEQARLANERARLASAAQARGAQDARWRAMVEASFRTFQSPGWGAFDDLDALQRGALYDAVWDAFERNGGNLTTLELEAIYRGYNPLNAAAPAMSLSSAPRSLSSVGRSLSAAGTPVRSGTDDYNDPAVQSLYEALYHLTQRRRGPLGPSEAEIQTANMGDYDLYSDPDGRWGRESGGYVAASLFSEELDYLSRSFVNGRNGLNGLLAQPFNVLLTWGDGANDLDLHLTGPTGTGATDRFHIYYAAVGNLEGFPFAQLIRDCICRSGSEVILTSNLLGGGVYRVSVFNFGDQGANSTNLANASNARIQIVRGGVAVAQGNGTTIQGGRLILDTTVPNGQFGNTWVAVELDPRTGRITVPRQIRQSEGSNNVR